MYKVWYAQSGHKTTKEIPFKSLENAKGLFEKLKNNRQFVYLIHIDEDGKHSTLDYYQQ